MMVTDTEAHLADLEHNGSTPGIRAGAAQARDALLEQARARRASKFATVVGQVCANCMGRTFGPGSTPEDETVEVERCDDCDHERRSVFTVGMRARVCPERQTGEVHSTAFVRKAARAYEWESLRYTRTPERFVAWARDQGITITLEQAREVGKGWPLEQQRCEVQTGADRAAAFGGKAGA